MFYSKSGAYCKGMFKLPETHFYGALLKPERHSLLTDLSLIRRLSKCVHFHHVVYGHTQVSLFVYIVILSRPLSLSGCPHPKKNIKGASSAPRHTRFIDPKYGNFNTILKMFARAPKGRCYNPYLMLYSSSQNF